MSQDRSHAEDPSIFQGPDTDGLSEQFQWHRKPAGWAGAPCPICGCEAKRLRALHRALPFPDNHRWGASHVKSVKVCFGTDSDIRVIR